MSVSGSRCGLVRNVEASQPKLSSRFVWKIAEYRRFLIEANSYLNTFEHFGVLKLSKDASG